MGSNIAAVYKVENEMLSFAEIIQILRRAPSGEDSSMVDIETEDSFRCPASEEQSVSETASTWVLQNEEPGPTVASHVTYLTQRMMEWAGVMSVLARPSSGLAGPSLTRPAIAPRTFSSRR